MRYRLTKINIYIYIYICVCVCVYVCVDSNIGGLNNSTRHSTRLVTLIVESIHLKINIISMRGWCGAKKVK